MSRYTYSKFKFYMWSLLYFFMTIFSFFLLAPLAYYLYSKKNVEHTIIDRKKLRFVGTIRGAYVTFIPFYCLYIASNMLIKNVQTWLAKFDFYLNLPTFIIFIVDTGLRALPTVLIYVLLVLSLFKWAQRNTHFCYNLTDSYLETNIRKSLFIAIIGKIVNTVTVGLLTPIIIKIKQEFIVERQYISNNTMTFDGTTKDAYRWFFIRQYLCVLTLGLYYPIYLYKTYQWRIIHTHIRRPA